MKIGFSVTEITSELGIYLTGYGMPERLAEGVHSPLNASVMVFEDGNTTAAVIGLDWCFVDWPLTQVIRKEILAPLWRRALGGYHAYHGRSRHVCQAQQG